MARKPEGPWYRTARRAWFAKIGGRQVNLGPDEKAAWEAFGRLMERREDAGTTATSLVTAFLAARAADVRPNTLEAYRTILEPFAAWVPGEVRAAAVEPRHIAEYCAARKYAPNTAKQVRRFHLATASRRALSFDLCLKFDSGPIESRHSQFMHVCRPSVYVHKPDTQFIGAPAERAR